MTGNARPEYEPWCNEFSQKIIPYADFQYYAGQEMKPSGQWAGQWLGFKMVVECGSVTPYVIAAHFDKAGTQHDPRVRGVVDWLVANSPLFAALWARQDVAGREGGPRLFNHPHDGPLALVQHVLADVDRGDFRLIVLIPANSGGSHTLPSAHDLRMERT